MHTVDHSKNIIELSSISFSYDHDEVLKNINLNIHQGDYIGLVGPNGAGKTTLLKIMLGIISPSRGIVKLFGKDIKDFKEWSRIGYVPQKATNFDSHFPGTVWDIVRMGRIGKKGLLHFLNATDEVAVKKALENVGMLSFKDRLISDLS